MPSITFRVDGPLMGAVHYRRRSDLAKKWASYKRTIYVLALEKGFDPNFVPHLNAPAVVGMSLCWKAEPRLDWEQVYKPILDTLFPPAHGGDRFVKPGQLGVDWMTGETEHVVVFVEW